MISVFIKSLFARISIYKKRIRLQKSRKSFNHANHGSDTIKKYLVSFICFLCIFTISPYPVFSQQAEQEKPKKRIAVLGFSANNADESLARIVRNNIEMNLFELNKFEVLEHDRVDDILHERKQLISECSDEECAANAGEMLSAQYVILGSVSRLEKYIVQIKVIDSAKKQLIILEKKEAETESELRNVSIDLSNIIADEIEDIGKKEKPLSFSAGFYYVTPLSYLKHKVDPGYGISISGRIEDVFIRHLLFGLELEYLYFNGKNGITHHAFMLPMTLCAGYDIPIFGFSILPSVSAGAAYNTVYYNTETDSLKYSKDSAMEPIVKGGLNIGYNFASSVYLGITSGYEIVFEKEGRVEFFTAGLSVRLRF